ncbi:hypothetical protein ACOME3_002007 [Neoechinorhynchus agilis]
MVRKLNKLNTKRISCSRPHCTIITLLSGTIPQDPTADFMCGFCCARILSKLTPRHSITEVCMNPQLRTQAEPDTIITVPDDESAPPPNKIRHKRSNQLHPSSN